MSVFHVTLPSNTKEPSENRTNSFTVRLANRLQFNADWQVGLASIVFPHSWSTLGTLKTQRIQVNWRSGARATLQLPRARVLNARELQSLITSHASDEISIWVLQTNHRGHLGNWYFELPPPPKPSQQQQKQQEDGNRGVYRPPIGTPTAPASQQAQQQQPLKKHSVAAAINKWTDFAR